jgi:hypothetical protein
VLEDETCSGVVALVVGGDHVSCDVVGGEILHRGNLMLEWGASAHFVCRCGGKVLGENSCETACAVSLRELAIDVLISSLLIAVKSPSSASSLRRTPVPHGWWQVCGPLRPTARPRDDCAGPCEYLRSVMRRFEYCGIRQTFSKPRSETDSDACDNWRSNSCCSMYASNQPMRRRKEPHFVNIVALVSLTTDISFYRHCVSSRSGSELTVPGNSFNHA